MVPMSDTEEEANLGTEYGLLIQEMTYCCAKSLFEILTKWGKLTQRAICGGCNQLGRCGLLNFGILM